MQLYLFHAFGTFTMRQAFILWRIRSSGGKFQLTLISPKLPPKTAKSAGVESRPNPDDY